MTQSNLDLGRLPVALRIALECEPEAASLAQRWSEQERCAVLGGVFITRRPENGH